MLWGVLASIVLHLLALLWFSQRDVQAPPATSLLILTARLAPAARTPREQSAPTPPQFAAPRPSKPATAPHPVLEKRVPARTRDVQKKAPVEGAKTAPAEPAPEPAAAAAPSPPPAAPEPAESASQAPVGPKTEATAKSGSEADKGTLEQYRLALIAATRRYKRYPAIAMEKGWQGRVEVHMEIGANGILANASIKSSSGHEILDSQAMDMLKKGKTTVQIPASLRGRAFSVDVPVIFNLDNPSS